MLAFPENLIEAFLNDPSSADDLVSVIKNG
jgi:hypothetical protein